MKKIISTESAPKAVGPYSQAVMAGDTLYVSGQIPVDPTSGKVVEGIEAQSRQAIENIGAILRQSDMTFDNVVKTTVLLDDMNNFAAMNAVYATYFTKQMPARACFQVVKLPMGVMVEIEAVAVR